MTIAGSQTAVGLSDDESVAVRRWKLGHHVFHVLLVAMNSSLASAQVDLERQSWDDLAGRLADLTVLYDAATAAMKYAADFDQAAYDSVLRPSMSPPYLSAGFSGTQNRDHARMIAMLRRLQQDLKVAIHASGTAVPPAVVEAARNLRSAQARNRRNHLFVCDKLVPGGSSLLQDYLRSAASDMQSTVPQRI